MPAPKHNVNTASCNVSEAFARTLDTLGPFEDSPHLVVALSGGADSTALLLLARAWASQRRGKVTALIVDHRLREASTREAEEVAARHHAIILTPEHTTNAKNLSEQAREWRYNALTEWCRTHDVLHLLVAHHADDQAETVALHTARGETEDGACGMAAVMIRDGVRILRPLLGVRKSALTAYLGQHNMTWVEDPTNANLQFKRNALRATMTDTMHHAFIETATREGALRAARDSQFAQAVAQSAEVSEHSIVLDLAKLRMCEPSLATRILADSLCTVSGSHTRPRKHETERLFMHVQETAFSRATLKRCLIEKRANTLHITPETAGTKAERQPKVLAASPFWWFNPRAL